MKAHLSKLEAAVMLGVSLRTIDAMVKREELPVIWCMGRPRIPTRAVEQLGKSTTLAIRRPPVEVIQPPQDELPEVLFDTVLERKLSQMAARSANSIFEPFFQSKSVADEIRRSQPAWERAKHKLVYAKWGCQKCETKSVPHAALGLCHKCYTRWKSRLEMVVKQAEEVFRKRSPMMLHDLTEEAQAALRNEPSDHE